MNVTHWDIAMNVYFQVSPMYVQDPFALDNNITENVNSENTSFFMHELHLALVKCNSPRFTEPPMSPDKIWGLVYLFSDIDTQRPSWPRTGEFCAYMLQHRALDHRQRVARFWAGLPILTNINQDISEVLRDCLVGGGRIRCISHLGVLCWKCGGIKFRQ